jgi:adenylate kinase
MSMSAKFIMLALVRDPTYTLHMDNREHINHIKTWLGTGSINIFGLPFAGKDSQGRWLAEMFDGTLLGGGDILRGSTIPAHIKAIISEGMLIPTEDFINIVLPYLSQPSLAQQPLILSAVGRWSGEEQGVIRALSSAGHDLKAVIMLHVTHDDVKTRWKAHEKLKDRSVRSDDAEHILQTRFNEFDTKTIPVIEHYRSMGVLIEIDASQPREQVQAEIFSQLLARSQPTTL